MTPPAARASGEPEEPEDEHDDEGCVVMNCPWCVAFIGAKLDELDFWYPRP